jgi:hypothetical protein
MEIRYTVLRNCKKFDNCTEKHPQIRILKTLFLSTIQYSYSAIFKALLDSVFNPNPHGRETKRAHILE